MRKDYSMHMKVLNIDRTDLIDIIELTYTHFRHDRIDTYRLEESL